MGRLLVLVFMLPWWAYIPASLGALWLGERVYEQALVAEADKAAALDAGLPPVVELTAFDWDRDVHAAGEVHVRGIVNHEFDYELAESTNGIPTTTRYLYMIFGENDPAGSNVVRAVLTLDKREDAEFLDTKADEWTVGESDAGRIYQFNGVATRSATLDDMVVAAIAEQGLTMSDDFVYIEPFFDGREAALTPRGVPEQTRYTGWAIAAIVALIGVAKRVMSVRARPSRAELEAAALAESDEQSALIPAPATSFVVPDGVSADTPLGRLAHRNTGEAEPVFGEVPADAAVDTADPVPVFATQDLSEEPVGARPRYAPIFDDGAPVAADAESRFPPVPDDGPEQARADGPSALGFYVKLGFGMLVVGGIAYKPSLIGAALPFAGVALFWLGIYVVFQKIRGARRQDDGAGPAPRHQRRPDGAAPAPAMATGVGGRGIDLTAPVRTSGPERGVI